MILCDTVSLEDAAVKFTREGFLTAPVKAARTGVQFYTAAELGLTDRAASEKVGVYRSPEEVFAKDSLQSFSMIDATIDHPREMVDSKNWRQLSVGSVGENVLRDGEFMVLPLILKDAEAIKAWRDGKKELSVGYACELVMEDGTAPDGQAYQARQVGIRANHLALCDAARGGPQLRVGDHDQPGEITVTLKTITFDGLQVADVSPAAEAVITKLQGQLTDAGAAKTAAEGEVVKLKAEAVAKDAEIVTLKQAVTDSAITPAKLRDAAKGYALVIGKAKALGVTVTDAMDQTAVMRAVVDAKMKDVKDEHLQVAFDALTASVKVEDAGPDPIREVFIDGGITNISDAQKARDDALAARNARFNQKESA